MNPSTSGLEKSRKSISVSASIVHSSMLCDGNLSLQQFFISLYFYQFLIRDEPCKSPQDLLLAERLLSDIYIELRPG